MKKIAAILSRGKEEGKKRRGGDKGKLREKGKRLPISSGGGLHSRGRGEGARPAMEGKRNIPWHKDGCPLGSNPSNLRKKSLGDGTYSREKTRIRQS